MRHTINNQGIYLALIAQLDKLARHNRQGSYRTRQRYYEAMQRFCAYLADTFHLQKLANISGKHLVSYVLYLQESGKSASTIKTDLAAIRFFHDKMDGKYRLPSNEELGVALERRRFGEIDRSWTPEELASFVHYCVDHDHQDYADIAWLAYNAGLRIHECFRLDTAAAEAARRTGTLTVKGKGGRIRTIPLTPEAVDVLMRCHDRVPRGQKLFVPADMPTDKAIARLQGFVRTARPEYQIVDAERPRTVHGLRHSYAANQYTERLSDGMTAMDAKRSVSRLLGHSRPEVTSVYLASTKRHSKKDTD